MAAEVIPTALAQMLDEAVERINTPDFIAADPVQFPRRYSCLQDIEIAAFLCATIAWGNRKMICRDCDRLLQTLGNEPYKFVMEGDFRPMEAERTNIHRTFFTDDLAYWLRGLHSVYSKHDSLDDFAKSAGAASETPAWAFAQALSDVLKEANGGKANARCLPTDFSKTALKRINMALRWLVRRDGIVDLGVWRSIRPAQLFIPLDVHVADTARALGLIERRSNDRRTVIELTERLRTLRPDDPAVYDFALFGIGIEKQSK